LGGFEAFTGVGVFPGLGGLVFDDGGGLRGYLGVLVNGVDVGLLDGFGTVLCGGDVVSVVPPLGGG
jgi:molybdopterin converting factor small subunit